MLNLLFRSSYPFVEASVESQLESAARLTKSVDENFQELKHGNMQSLHGMPED